MIFQLKAIQEIELLLYLTVMILYIELVIYFFYRYFKIKDEKLPLNKVLLSFGTFYSFLILGITILVFNRFFISDLNLKEILDKIGYLSIIISPVIFLFFMNIEEFSKTINLEISRYIMIFSLLPILIIIFVQVNSLFTFIFIVGLFSYPLIIQIKVISISKDNIKKRFLQFLLGNLLSIFSLFYIFDIFIDLNLTENINISFMIGLASLIVGFISTSLGVYTFPAFYEFKWKINLLSLFIINQNNNTILYNQNFSNIKSDYKKKDYEKLFSSAIIGIDKLVTVITNTQDSKVNKIKQADSLILIEYGSDLTSGIIYALIVKEDLKSNSYFLKSIKTQFESFYKEILSDINYFKGNEEQLFASFDIIIKNLIYQR
ncbi:MAG: hypothetical protein ACFFD5_15775 [Candidatus Thorarchaeota archaeon]